MNTKLVLNTYRLWVVLAILYQEIHVDTAQQIVRLPLSDFLLQLLQPGKIFTGKRFIEYFSKMVKIWRFYSWQALINLKAGIKRLMDKYKAVEKSSSL